MTLRDDMTADAQVIDAATDEFAFQITYEFDGEPDQTFDAVVRPSPSDETFSPERQRKTATSGISVSFANRSVVLLKAGGRIVHAGNVYAIRGSPEVGPVRTSLRAELSRLQTVGVHKR